MYTIKLCNHPPTKLVSQFEYEWSICDTCQSRLLTRLDSQATVFVKDLESNTVKQYNKRQFAEETI